MIGKTIGPYQVTAKVGAGGMGEVYRARDTKLGRDVALKILPEAFARDPDRLARFRREAQLLAALNHPNIAQIFGVEDSGDINALVMELVEGPTLEDAIAAAGQPEGERVNSSPRDGASATPRESLPPPAPGVGPRHPEPSRAPRGMKIDDALAIAKQICDALEAAHEQGIVHRDLKPANVKLKGAWGPAPTRQSDGDRSQALEGADVAGCTVKVLDFGLAKALGSESASASGALSGSMSPTITTPAMTEMGMILGTAAYMSPEQARGRPADRRSDVWAFGAVLYEMLTGRRAFAGDDVSDTMASVLKADVDWSAFPADVPATVVTVIKRCLQRDRRQRARDIGDVRLALEGAFETAAPPPASAVAVAQPVRRRPVAAVLGASAAVALAAALTAWAVWPTAEPGTPARFLYELPAGQQYRRTGRPVMALARDGRAFVYNAVQGLYLRSMDAELARLIPGTQVDLTNPFFSPDGQSVGYYDMGASQLRRIDVAGGVSVLIAPAANPFGVSWEADDTILFGQPEGILRVPAAGGTPEVVSRAAKGEQMHGPQLLPESDAVLFCVTTSSDWDEAKVVVESLSTHERTVLVNGGCEARYLPTGHLVYALEGGLFAQAFDPRRRTVSGVAVPLLQGLMRAGGITGAANYAVSDNGTLVYASGESLTTRVPVWVDGQQHREEPLGVEPGNYSIPRLSPDRTRVAFGASGGLGDVYVWDVPRKVLTNVTASDTSDYYALWNREGTRLIFSSARDGQLRLYWQAADGTGTPEPLTEGGQVGVTQYPQALSPDGARLVYRQEGGTGGSNLRMLSLKGDHATEDLLSTEFTELNAEVSPNGHWLAYESNRDGQANVYVSPFPGAAARQWKISPAGGTKPAWALDGRQLFYVDAASRLMAARVDPSQPALVFDQPQALFDVSGYWTSSQGRTYDVDAGRFLFLKNALADADARPQIHIVQHWVEELKRRVPVR